MRLRQGLREIAITLIRDDDRSASLGDEEICAGDADIGGEEALAQHLARLGEELRRLRQIALGIERRVHAAEIGLDLVAVEMHGRGNDVGGNLAAQLDDVFAEIGLDRRHAGLFQRGVDFDLLADHRFALGDRLGTEPRANLDDDGARLLRGAGEMHMPARLRHLALIALEIEIEMRQGMVLDVARRLA